LRYDLIFFEGQQRQHSKQAEEKRKINQEKKKPIFK